MGEEKAEKENKKKDVLGNKVAELQEKVGFLCAFLKVRHIPGKGTIKGRFIDQFGNEITVK